MKKNIEDIYALAPMQQGMLFHTLYAPEAQIYITQMGCLLEGELSVPEFKHAWQTVVDRHSILRTAFIWERRTEPLQIVFRDVQLSWLHEDWQELSPDQQQERFPLFMESNQTRGFDLSRPPLMRPALIHLAENRYYLVLCHHHLLMDGWSLPLLLAEVFSCYAAYCLGKSPQLPPKRPYRDYIEWLEKQDLFKAEVFWRQSLAGFVAPTPLDLEIPTQTTDEDVYKDTGIILPSEISSGLETLARENELTLSILIQAAWALLLHQYSGEKDVVFGLATSGRPAQLSGVASMIGLFVNTLPHRVRIAPEASLISWLHELQENLAGMLEYEYSPLVQVQGWSQVPRGIPLFESLLIFDNYPVNDFVQQQAGDLKIQFLRSIEHTNYPLTLRIRPGADIYIGISYSSVRFRPEAIERIFGHLLTLLTLFIAQPAQCLKDLNILSAKEREQLLFAWNDTTTPYDAEKSLAVFFEEQVMRTPESVAAVFEETSLTYQQINARANKWARYLKTQGIQQGTLVGIHMERSLDMLIAVLSVLKAGGTYVPLDPTYPAERLEFISKDAQIALLLTQQSLAKSPLSINVKTVCLDAHWSFFKDFKDFSVENNEINLSSRSLAYVIYTSGSTGKPKGVQIPHTAVVNFLQAMQKHLCLDSKDTFLAVTSLSFDIAALELFLPLLTGARLLIADQTTTFDGERLIEQMAGCAATVMQATPATWRLLIAAGWQGQPDLKILCGGEALSQELAAELIVRSPFVLNLYGPTESTIWSTYYRVSTTTTSIPIGRPLDNTQTYILNSYLQPVPVGVRGDLYIGGKGLAYGYLRRPDLTAERFIPHPFAATSGERLYKTGDIARNRSDGCIEYLGRSDHQVKLHGFRIELEEIESVLARHAQILQNIVFLREDLPGDKRLVCYIKPVGTPPSSSALRDFLQEKLPSYMIPTSFVFLADFPLTPNGKIDYLGLSAPDNFRPSLDEEFVSAKTPEEQSLTQIWEQALHVDRIGVNDNFFDLGGHSLLIMQLYSKVREHFQRDFPLVDLFKYPTIAAQAKYFSSEVQVEEEKNVTLEQADSRAQLRTQQLARQKQFREKQRNSIK